MTKQIPSFVMDMLGQEVRVGDRLAYPAMDGNSVSMRVGRVLEFKLSKSEYSPQLKISLEIEKVSGWGASVGSKVSIETRRVRYIKLLEK